MNITILGGHGQIAQLLIPKLKNAGHNIRALVRKEEQFGEIRTLGAEPVLCDVETQDDISIETGKADAVVFAAGAGPGSGKERKLSVDRDGAIKLIDACKKNGIDRYVMISAMGLETPRGNEVFQEYQKAKYEADQALKKSGLKYTIVKPGKLLNEPAHGSVEIGKNLPSGQITREDVADVIHHALEEPKTAKKEFDLIAGDYKIEEAIEKIAN